jgi:hypothetical protein
LCFNIELCVVCLFFAFPCCSSWGRKSSFISFFLR